MEEPDRDEAALLKSLRLSAGMEPAELGALVNLSAGQIRQLEDGGISLFYSPQIKTQALRRVVRFLELPQPSGKPTKVQVPEVTPRSSANVIEDIIRLSEKNLKGNVVSSPIKRPFNTQKFLSVLFLFGLLAGFYLLWVAKRDVPQSMFSEWVEPLTHGVNGANPPATSAKADAVHNSQLFKSSPTTTTTVVSSSLNTASPAPSVKTVDTPVATAPSATAPVATAPAATAPAAIAPVASPSSKPSSPAVAAPAAEPTKSDSKPPVKAQPEVSQSKNADSKSEQAAAKDDTDCASIKGEPVEARSVLANKAGNYVFMQASKPVQICIEDAQRHRSVLTLEAGVGRSIHGDPPWVIASRNLKSVQIYFQGAKVPVPADSVSRIILKEQTVSP